MVSDCDSRTTSLGGAGPDRVAAPELSRRRDQVDASIAWTRPTSDPDRIARQSPPSALLTRC